MHDWDCSTVPARNNSGIPGGFPTAISAKNTIWKCLRNPWILMESCLWRKRWRNFWRYANRNTSDIPRKAIALGNPLRIHAGVPQKIPPRILPWFAPGIPQWSSLGITLGIHLVMSAGVPPGTPTRVSSKIWLPIYLFCRLSVYFHLLCRFHSLFISFQSSYTLISTCCCYCATEACCSSPILFHLVHFMRRIYFCFFFLEGLAT